MRPRLPLLILALLASAPLASADFITGTVVDANGNPVPGININAFRVSNGNEQNNLQNDGTDAAGHFLTTLPADLYDLQFVPPAPPGSTHVTLVLHNVVVVGTKDLGVLHLEAGVSVSGHIQTQAGVPVSQVLLNVLDAATGEPIVQAQHKSDGFGNFALAVPKRPIELQLDATGLLLATLASRSFDLNLAANTNLGNITLLDGFVVTGSVVRQANGLGVGAVDLDFFDHATGVKLFTPNDNSNALGAFSVVVPAGNYDIEFCPPFATTLVGKRIPPRAISTNTPLGNVALDPGFVMTGTIRSFSGAIQVNSDVDVNDQVTGAKVVTCSDNTNASGVYSIIVPAGTLKVLFHPPTFNVPLGTDIHRSVVVTGNTTLNGTLPSCPAPNNYGVGLAGTGGITPHLTTSGGSPVSDNGAFAIDVQSGRGGSVVFLMVSLQQAAIPNLGGTLLVNPNPSLSFYAPFVLGGAAGAAGAGSLHLPANVGLAAGFDLYMQAFVQDPGAVQGWAFSEGLHFRACR